MVWFLKCSLSEFNQTPHFTDFTFADEVIYNRYGHVIVEGACIMAWAAQMVLEAGREFSIQDQGIGLNVPTVSGALNNELRLIDIQHTITVIYIKSLKVFLTRLFLEEPATCFLILDIFDITVLKKEINT